MWSCLALCCGSLVLASFATEVGALSPIKIYFWLSLCDQGLAPHLASRSVLWDRRRRALRAGDHLCESLSASILSI